MQGISVPRPPENGDVEPEWSWKYEQRYGAPKLEDRESVLLIAFQVLSDAGTDIGLVVDTLYHIKHMAFESAMDGLTTDF
ncbi:MAG TPA: hypothetical protein VJU59_48205, partial [Paraburkholderia sp.]|uniref:hypothetical protein n=1 Tax=Paraburkholderia sp. TaxID=1926495 RepID=UPI002B4AA83C